MMAEVRIPTPLELTGASIESVEHIPRGGDVHRPIRDDGNGFLAAGIRLGLKIPGKSEAGDVAGVNPLQRAVVRLRVVMAVGEPFGRARRLEQRGIIHAGRLLGADRRSGECADQTSDGQVSCVGEMHGRIPSHPSPIQSCRRL